MTNDVLETGEVGRDLKKSSSTLEDLLEFIREGMREGRLVPGQRLVERELMQRQNVSRGTVREALVHLRAEGLVEFERFRGASIRILSRQKVIELNTIRGVLEGFAARLCAERLDDGGRKRLVAIHEGFDPSRDEYRGYNESFHNAIIELSGNTSLSAVIATTLLETFRVQFHALLSRQDSTRRSFEEHNAILQAILDRRPDEAESLMISHIESSCRQILDAPAHYFK